MTDDIIKQVPYLLENPIVIMQSITTTNRIVVAGELIDADGKPVISALELKPDGRITNIIKIASVYAKDNFNELFYNSDILYLDPNKNRTDNWIQALRLQLSVGVSTYGSISRITYSDKNVKGEIEFNAKDMNSGTLRVPNVPSRVQISLNFFFKAISVRKIGKYRLKS